MEPVGTQCSLQPGFVFLVVTLIVTTAATAMLCVSIMTEHWEYLTWNRDLLRSLDKESRENSSSEKDSNRLEWLFDDQVVRVILAEGEGTEKTSQSVGPREEENKTTSSFFLVPIHGGIWTFCIALSGMQNLSISCALVCLIILGSSALLGLFGITKHQISAVLITGVMYLLAAAFATFSLTIINFKRAQGKTNSLNGSTTQELVSEGVVISTIALEKSDNLKKLNKYLDARIFSPGWSLHMGWGGTGMCILVSVLWMILSKIMRYNPLNMLIGLT